MSKLIKLPASALYVPDDELTQFTSTFDCSPEAFGSIDITVSDEAYSAVQTTLTMTTGMKWEYALEYGDVLWRREGNCIAIPRGLISAQHNIPGRFKVLRSLLSRNYEEPRIHLLISDGHTYWWLYYHLRKVPSVTSILPGIRFKVTQ